MKISRGGVLAAIAVVLAVVVIVRWVSGWGLITLNVTDAPLFQVLKSMERQSGIRIVTNADPMAPISMRVKKVPLPEALALVAERLDGMSRLAYVAAPGKSQLEELLAYFSSNSEPTGWKLYLYSDFGGGGVRSGGNDDNGRSSRSRDGNNRSRGGDDRSREGSNEGGPRGGGGFAGGFIGGFLWGNDEPPDPVKVSWTVSDVPEKTVQSYLSQGAQKTGVMFAVPEGWNPPVRSLPAKGSVRDIAAKVAKSGGGKIKEVYFVIVRPRQPERSPQVAGSYPNPEAPTFFSRRSNDRPNREWLAERANAQIEALPPQEQEMAKKMREEFAAIRNLPDDERRQKMEEIFQRSEVQEMIENRMASGDARRTPQQRADRYQRYIQRKLQAKKSGS